MEDYHSYSHKKVEITDLNDHLDKSDESEASWPTIAWRLHNQGFYKEATAYYDKIIGKNPYTARYYNRRGWSKYFAEDVLGADDDFKQAIALADADPEGPHAEPYYGCGLVNYALGNFEQAINNFKQAIDLVVEVENESWYYTYRGLTYYHIGNYESAISDLIEATQLNYANIDFHAYLNYIKNAASNTNLHIEIINEQINVDMTVAQDLDEQDLNGLDPIFFYSESWAEYINGNPLKALENYTKNNEENLTARFYNLYGLAYYMLNEHEAAIEYFDKAISLQANVWQYYNRRGLAYFALENFGAAIEDYRKAIEMIAAKSSPYHGTYMPILYANLNRAIKILEALENSPNLEMPIIEEFNEEEYEDHLYDEKEQELANLKAEIDDSRNELLKLRQQLAELEQKDKHLEEIEASRTRELEEKERKYAEIIKKQEEQIQEQIQDRKRLLESFDNLQTKLTEVEEQKNEKFSQICRLSKELEEIKNEKAKLEKQLRKIEIERAKLKIELEEQTASPEEYAKRFNELNEEKRKIEVEKKRLEAREEELDEEEKKLESARRRLEKEYEALENFITLSPDQRESYKQSIKRLYGLQEDLDRTIKAFPKINFHEAEESSSLSPSEKTEFKKFKQKEQERNNLLEFLTVSTRKKEANSKTFEGANIMQEHNLNLKIQSADPNDNSNTSGLTNMDDIKKREDVIKSNAKDLRKYIEELNETSIVSIKSKEKIKIELDEGSPIENKLLIATIQEFFPRGLHTVKGNTITIPWQSLQMDTKRPVDFTRIYAQQVMKLGPLLNERFKELKPELIDMRFCEALEEIGAKFNPEKNNITVFICYSWGNKFAKEADKFVRYLNRAGLATPYFDLDNGPGKRTLPQQLDCINKAHFIMIIATKLLKAKHETDYETLLAQKELAIMQKYKINREVLRESNKPWSAEYEQLEKTDYRDSVVKSELEAIRTLMMRSNSNKQRIFSCLFEGSEFTSLPQGIDQLIHLREFLDPLTYHEGVFELIRSIYKIPRDNEDLKVIKDKFYLHVESLKAGNLEKKEIKNIIKQSKIFLDTYKEEEKKAEENTKAYFAELDRKKSKYLPKKNSIKVEDKSKQISSVYHDSPIISSQATNLLVGANIHSPNNNNVPGSALQQQEELEIQEATLASLQLANQSSKR